MHMNKDTRGDDSNFDRNGRALCIGLLGIYLFIILFMRSLLYVGVYLPSIPLLQPSLV